MKSKYIIMSAAAVGAMFASVAFAEIGANLDVNASAGVSSTTLRARLEAEYGTTSPSALRADILASTTANRQAHLQNRENTMKDRGNTEIEQRIASLNALLGRVNAMVKVSATDKATLGASINTEISDLSTLDTTIAADTSTTSLKTDIQSVTKAYRIYLLVIPQASIAAAADRVLTIAADLNTVAAKIQAQAGTNSTAASALADLALKTADATTQANAAVAETASLQPDNGDTTVAASNTAALKDAKTKLQTATQDLKTAQQDAETAIKAIRPNSSSNDMPGSEH